ncbi:acyl-coenzyme A oxidase-like protein [Lingula anatina]|uniref:Acyl-coenzyme A oxidase n=1 Tax=Lingula anatina TaxID=7574 RepID=A0A1S3KFC2_LINAN|nr:acyl-coenzyme A oxidase-like protein [Lingula anatina]|eukprot:XP_013421333.1 acyl-coenzyme A oxidase-like protein [Lingula anatina]
MAAPSRKPPTSLSRFLDGDFWEVKEKLREYIEGNELFNLRFDLPLSDYRDVTRERALYLFRLPEIQEQFDEQASSKQNFTNRSLALGELCSATDLSVGIKSGVMAWLFGGVITNLGSEEHIKRWFVPLKELKFTGMFAMSERGHGSNVKGILTQAHYDQDTKQFIINTPCLDAEKIYIGNALQGNYAAVFAQVYVKGQCKGPHCFIVPVRDEQGQLLPGITITDMGLKEGLNGVDNGLVAFDNVRIPRENLLNRFADVSLEGEYVTKITNDNARFNAMLGTMLAPRLALCFQALAATKVGLEIAVKYSLRRRQFGPSEGPEELIMNYQTHQLRLMPCLAMCLGLTFAVRHAGSLLDDALCNQRDLVNERGLQALAAGLKAFCTWESVKTLQTCRESVGGMGYMEENRLPSLKRDADVFVTFEGDNMVMLQQVAKELLTQYSKQFESSRVAAMLSSMTGSFMSSVKTSKFAVTLAPVSSMTFIRKALAFKEDKLLRSLASRLFDKVSTKLEPPFTAWNQCLHHSTTLAWCYIHKVTLEQYMAAVDRCPEERDKEIMMKFCKLYAVHLLYEDRAWFLENNYITAAMAKDLRQEYIKLCAVTREHALEVVEAFRHPSNCVHAPIAGIPSSRAPWAYYPDSDMELTPPQSKL